MHTLTHKENNMAEGKDVVAVPASILEGFKLAETEAKKIEEKVESELKKESAQAKEEGVGVLDVLSEKILSRKLLVWLTASVFLGFGKLTPDEWVAVSLGYIGMQGFADLATKWKGR